MAIGGIGRACTNGVVSGLCVGFGVQGIGSGGGVAAAAVAAACAPIKSVANPFLEVKTVIAPPAAPSLSAVRLVNPPPFVDSMSFFFLRGLDFVAGSRCIFIELLSEASNPGSRNAEHVP